jgi:hypothetical protein
MRLTTLVLCGITAAAVVPAQQIALHGPVEGFLFDAPTRSLRAVTGVPGSATFGPALSHGLEFASVAPHENYAIAFQSGNCLFVSALDSSQPSVSVLSDIAAQPDGIVWSADGSQAVLYSRSGNWIQTLTGFPSAPVPANYLDVSSLGGTLSAVAGDSQGKVAIAVDGAAGGVYLTHDSQSPIPVLQTPNVLALSFSADGNTLYALDPSAPQVVAVDLASFSSRILPLDGLADPLSIRTGQDAQGRAVLYVASGSDQVLRMIDLASGQVLSDVPLSVAPTGIDTLGHNSFVLTARAGDNQPLWLFTSSPQPAVYFIPAIATLTRDNSGPAIGTVARGHR